ncbi:uncharacterized protein LOC105693853 isoform X1 [Athalia rosae]|uniref:uncharacterized protein LOC105693853 isoform X1 n=1 Tax=Athalia rosae TaxID=37344 RepID=UPI0020348CC2|nr:uncharacterized protein LOC105693853 isoform X1 [Athalia rosae]XP_020712516.2 uncharacterized protein LOC105693853 isoform X1 [Athalia rosae]XP_020712517.2 uncharacterized protein LOC105693853 isoform X1 [Athalia rosae]XP_048510497.1 uncharacterized protein LOC105693853 isoform X1 [Athalia rosae]
MPQPKQISATDAPREIPQTQNVVLLKRSTLDKPWSILSLNRKTEVINVRAQFTDVNLIEEWGVPGGVGESGKVGETEAEKTIEIVGGVAGEAITGKTAARTEGISFDRDTEDVRAGPSAIDGSKFEGKKNRGTTRSKRRDVESRGTGIQMHPISSSEQRLATDDTDTSSMSSVEHQRRSRQLLVGWDTFRSRTMLLLIVLLFVWAVIYFPLILA